MLLSWLYKVTQRSGVDLAASVASVTAVVVAVAGAPAVAVVAVAVAAAVAADIFVAAALAVAVTVSDVAVDINAVAATAVAALVDNWIRTYSHLLRSVSIGVPSSLSVFWFGGYWSCYLLWLPCAIIAATIIGDVSFVAACEKPLVMTIINDGHDQRLL